MPRYTFHLTDGKEVLKAPRALDLPGRAAARDEALRFARELKQEQARSDRSWQGWFVEVKDRHGKVIERIAVDLVPDLTLPPLR